MKATGTAGVVNIHMHPLSYGKKQHDLGENIFKKTEPLWSLWASGRGKKSRGRKCKQLTCPLFLLLLSDESELRLHAASNIMMTGFPHFSQSLSSKRFQFNLSIKLALIRKSAYRVSASLGT